MKRSALSDFFRHLVLSALPLAAACNGGGLPSSGPQPFDGAPPPLDEGPSLDGGRLDGPAVDLACDPFAKSFDCVRGGYVAVSGPLPVGHDAACRVCAQVCPPTPPPFDGCYAIDWCGLHGVQCSRVGIGRRPAGLAEEPAALAAEHGVGDALAQMAYLEAASVPAFRVLARELSGLGAPADLVARARRAALDEIRHARTVGALARRHGVEPARPAVRPRPPRGLLEVARENAVEGCVRESFGALLATYQARAAADPEVRRAMVGIAADETRHAELAWAVAAWAEPRLADEERGELQAARRAALAELIHAWHQPVPAATRAALGEPPPEVALRLALAFAAHVEQPAA